MQKSFQELLECYDNDLENNIKNNAWNLEHNAEKSQEILNRIKQGIMSIITLALVHTLLAIPWYIQTNHNLNAHNIII